MPSISRSLLTALLSLASATAANVLHERQSSSSPVFSGTSNYYLHGLYDPTEKSNFISQLQKQGAKVVRLWVQGTGGGCTKGSKVNDINELEPNTLGVFDDSVLKAIDDTLVQLHAAGMKAIIVPHDSGKLNLSRDDLGPGTAGGPSANGHDVYGDTWLTDQFYTEDAAIAAYDRRLTHILNYQSQVGRKWAQMPDYIAAFDIENEPFLFSTPLLDSLDAKGWLCGRAGTIKALTGKTGPWVTTGAVAGACEHNNGNSDPTKFFTYNFFPPALSCADIDVMSVHGFVNSWTDPHCQPSYLNGATNSKYMMVEEFGVTGLAGSPNFDNTAKLFNEGGIPWLYWQNVPGFDQDQGRTCTGVCCHDYPYLYIFNHWDGYEINLNDTAKGNFAAATSNGNMQYAKFDWTKTPFLTASA